MTAGVGKWMNEIGGDAEMPNNGWNERDMVGVEREWILSRPHHFY